MGGRAFELGKGGRRAMKVERAAIYCVHTTNEIGDSTAATACFVYFPLSSFSILLTTARRTIDISNWQFNKLEPRLGRGMRIEISNHATTKRGDSRKEGQAGRAQAPEGASGKPVSWSWQHNPQRGASSPAVRVQSSWLTPL